MLTQEIRTSIDESVLCWLATVGANGEPNCSPKEVFVPYGEDELVIANIASPESVKNIKVNKQVCVSFVHVLKQKGFKVKGEAVYLTAEVSGFMERYQLIEPVVGDVFPVRGIISIKIKHINPIIAPGYYLVPGTTEATQIEHAKRTYGV